MIKTSESSENYLKTIYELETFQGYARSVDIANLLEVSKASVCIAMKKLIGKKLIEMDYDKKIHLTASGEKLAAEIEEKYLLIKQLLMSVLHMDEPTAAEDACRLEHVIDTELLSKIELEVY